MSSLSREAAVLEQATKTRARLKCQFEELVASQVTITELSQSVNFLEREAREIALRNSIVIPTTDRFELDNNSKLQVESNLAFRALDNNFKAAASQIAVLKKMILDLDEVIANVQARSGVIS